MPFNLMQRYAHSPKRAYTWFSEDFTIIGDLFHSSIFHFHAFLIILFALAGWWLSKSDANNSRA